MRLSVPLQIAQCSLQATMKRFSRLSWRWSPKPDLRAKPAGGLDAARLLGPLGMLNIRLGSRHGHRTQLAGDSRQMPGLDQCNTCDRTFRCTGQLRTFPRTSALSTLASRVTVLFETAWEHRRTPQSAKNARLSPIVGETSKYFLRRFSL